MDINQFQEIGLRTTAQQAAADNKARGELGQDEFLQLMTTQLSNQDPLKPMDNGDFLAQIAQFGTVSGVKDLNTSFNSFASSLQSSQALQASTLIGRDVLIENDQAYLGADGNMPAAVELDRAADNVSLNIYSANNELLGQVDAGAQSAGLVQFNWDGMTLNGNQAAPGNYRVEVSVKRGSNEVEALSPMVAARVNSLTLGAVGKEMQVELEQLGQVDFSRVLQIL